MVGRPRTRSRAAHPSSARRLDRDELQQTVGRHECQLLAGHHQVARGRAVRSRLSRDAGVGDDDAAFGSLEERTRPRAQCTHLPIELDS